MCEAKLRAIDLALLTPQWKRRALVGVRARSYKAVARGLAPLIALKTAKKAKPVPRATVRPV